MNVLRLSTFSLLLLSGSLTAQTMVDFHYTVSMDSPSTHKFHIILHCSGLTEPVLDFRMPAWMPCYYQILDYAKNVGDFHATDATGHSISWSKTDKNTWRVEHPSTTDLTISYDVSATNPIMPNTWPLEGWALTCNLRRSRMVRQNVAVKFMLYPRQIHYKLLSDVSM